MATLQNLYNSTFPTSELQNAVNLVYGIDNSQQSYDLWLELMKQGYVFEGSPKIVPERLLTIVEAYPTCNNDFLSRYTDYTDANYQAYFALYGLAWNQATGLDGVNACMSNIEFYLSNNYTYNNGWS